MSLKSLKDLVPQGLKNYYHLLNALYYNNVYGSPSSKLKIIGVTGTDGKTTTSTMIYEILKAAGKKVGLISTISAKISNRDYPLGFHVTTPDPKLLQKFLKEMVAEELEYVVLETTSHGLDQYRVGGIKYFAAVYTNITHEHLDYHKTFENYRIAKMRMIGQSIPGGLCVINKDDESWSVITENAIAKKLQAALYSQENSKPNNLNVNEVNASNITETNSGIEFELDGTQIKLTLPGKYNVSNALAAITLALKLGIDIEICKAALENMSQLEGRWMVLQEKPFKVVVDFAHTPNALSSVLQYAKTQLSKDARLFVVFGAAGLRDFTKRPLMGEVAGKYADVVVLTSEDTRTEKIENIHAQLIEGVTRNPNKVLNRDYFAIVDRREAIEFAIKSAKENDIVLITGKGHEKSMNLDGKGEVHWDDVEATEEILKSNQK
jgi:UDP-N-acetylmuramoyl-L-alanyl-D-glutamate--2,6-diaminopimelate ligase